jgi:uncharacterized protein (DUF983 family)
MYGIVHGDMHGLLQGAHGMTSELKGKEKWRWIFATGWHGHCPQCAEGRMFPRWLKLAKTCPSCGLDYDFASPDDGPAFFSLCFVSFPLLFLVLWFELALGPPLWVHFLTTMPLMILCCTAALQPIKGWLVASQYVNKAQEAGSHVLWVKLNARAKGTED